VGLRWPVASPVGAGLCPGPRILNLYGTEGGATLEPELHIFTEKRGVRVDMTPAPPEVSGHEMEVVHFVDCILGRAEPIAPGADGVTVQRMLDAIYRSAETGKEVAVGGAK